MGPRGKWLIGGGVGALLVVVVLVIITPLGRRDVSHHRTPCATNLKLLGQSLAVYAQQYSDQLPVAGDPFGGTWMTDQSPDWVGSQSNSYCPSNLAQDPATLWGGPAATYRVTGYVWTNERAGMPNLAGLRPNPPLEYHQKFNRTPHPGATELAADWIISDTPVAAGAKWSVITLVGRPGTYDTSHVSRGAPAGANCLMFDGHVEWRVFNPATATAVPQGAGGPSFWFAAP